MCEEKSNKMDATMEKTKLQDAEIDLLSFDEWREKEHLELSEKLGIVRLPKPESVFSQIWRKYRESLEKDFEKTLAGTMFVLLVTGFFTFIIICAICSVIF